MTPTEPAPEQAQPAEGPGQAPQIVVLIHRDKEGNWTIGPGDKRSNSERFRDHDTARTTKPTRSTGDGAAVMERSHGRTTTRSNFLP